MNPERAYIPAIKLNNGEVLSGEAHSILALKAFEMGFHENLVAGHLNAKENFLPVYPKDEDIVPKIKSKPEALEFAHLCSKTQRDACERLSKNGNKYFKIVVERWDTLRRLPMVVAAKRLDNNYIYTDGPSHGEIIRFHPDITFVETASHTHQLAIAGFLHDDGRFLTREQAALVSKQLTGVVLNEGKMISGEEWIPHIEDENDAKDYGERMHFKGLGIAKQRIDIFTSLRKHSKHIKLLKIAIKICERKKALEIYSRLNRSKR